ncbi:hypothetical protein J7I80_09270 [Bacillus sp. ISL-41]|uniref:hypothetical protein n=1 Tax=Bacillus sp. ISL-41 TaxID=2819127 RepID=UPI001BECB35B|nr:hypothetical protein [Bacillus sp. ISL-41]MBT2642416.1 hypothetical protein [Bacillus sp. ISL-41]
MARSEFVLDHIEIHDMKQSFLDFYEKAAGAEVNPEERWKLWQEYYGFAAVPPGTEGEKLARQLLDNCWEQYEQHIDDIISWNPDQAAIKDKLGEVKQVLGFNDDITLLLLFFVGNFEGNAFIAPTEEGNIALCFPIETQSYRDSEILLLHELAHVVHSHKADHSAGWERSIASVIIQEGIAMHTSKVLAPGRKLVEYIGNDDQWLTLCNEKELEILSGAIPFLEKSDSESVFRFTVGEGICGFQNEAYFIGWKLVEHLLENGMSLSDLAGFHERELPGFVATHLNQYIESKWSDYVCQDI